MHDHDVADRLLAKLRRFTAELDEDERAMLGALLAPGVAKAYEPEVTGFEVVEWGPASLPGALAQALRDGGVGVTGLDAD